jgi:ergothioneine biosynthesis protein EgtB
MGRLQRVPREAPSTLEERYLAIRSATLRLAEPLTPEDQQIQSMPEASPVKWHLAHTSWFFEKLVLGIAPLHPEFDVLFNSYYEALGPRVARGERGLLSRPSHREVLAYREHVDEAIAGALQGGRLTPRQLELLELGLQHEQQHQELILTDIKHALSRNPTQPAYAIRSAPKSTARAKATPLGWRSFPEGLQWVGAEATGFAFDNERPRHRVFIEAFELASRAVTCGEYQAFIDDGGYRRPELWLSDGWAAVQSLGWRAPFYWDEAGSLYTLGGARSIDPDEPVCHVSHYEADAYARWADARLPTEQEWEVAANGVPEEAGSAGGRAEAEGRSMPTVDGNFVESGRLHPSAASPSLFGDVWEWTQSAYAPYPGFRPDAGAVGEYNGKFMSGQLVLRGGSCASPRSHLRASYRNFFPPAARWQFSGLRLAR